MNSSSYLKKAHLVVLMTILWASIFNCSVWAAQYAVDASAADGGDGTADRPFKTIQQGVNHAQPGDTVDVKKGTYPEQITIARGGTSQAPLILKADPIGSVIVDGADTMKGLTEDTTYKPADKSKVWVLNGYKSPYLAMGNAYNLRADWLKEGEVGRQQVELLSRNDMVWVDGRFLDEVDTADQLAIGTFWVDRDKGNLYIPLPAVDSAEDHLIEATQRGTLLQGPAASFVHVRGFHFTRASGAGGTAVMKIGSYTTEGWVVEDNIADWGTFSGMQIYGKNNQITRNIVAHNGDEGMQGIIHDTVLDGNSSLYNNWKNIRDTYESGGGKFTESDHVTFRNHLAAYNRGPGLWFDINNTNITIERSRFHDNKYAGLFFEIAPGPTEIRGNTSYANEGAGILLGESMHATVENNICAFNWYGIELRNLQDRHGKFGEWNPKSTEPMWQVSNITIRNNILLKNIRAGLAGTSYYFDPVADRISSDNNIFWGSDIIAWAVPDKKGPDANLAKPSAAIAVDNGFWIFDGGYFYSKDKEKFGLDQHSVWKDPRFPNDDMYQLPLPDSSVDGEYSPATPATGP